MSKYKWNLIQISIIIISCLLINPRDIFSDPDYQGDLKFTNSNPNLYINIKIETGDALCYEGMNMPSDGNPNNRYYEPQNGTFFKKYFGTIYPLPYYQANANYNGDGISGYNLAPQTSHTYNCNSAQSNPNNSFSYGYSKYKITISVGTTITHIFYLNTTDSKYSHKDYPDYRRDLTVIFYGENLPVEFRSNDEFYRNIETFNPNPGFVIPELKIWDVCGIGRVENKFYVRSTPFGIRPDYPETYRAKVYINEELVFDGVHDNTQFTQKGYNTINIGTTECPNYYNYPPIPINDLGNTYMSPSYLFLSAIQGASMGTNFEFKNGSVFDLGGINGANQKMWISSYSLDPSDNSDVFSFKEGSKIILRPNSVVHTYKQGKLKDEGSIKELSTGSMFRAWEHSQMEFTGNNKIHNFNNGFKMVIDGGATLKVGDNTTLVFDGLSNGPNLKLDPNAIVQLGQNAKIVFKNGAYLDANGATFSGINGATWQGIEFDHSGTNNIRYCTFNNASTTLKFLCDPGNEITNSNISDNTFYIPGAQTGSYTYGIYSQDMNYVGIGNNNFIMQQGNMSVGLCMKFTNSTSSSSSSAYYKILIYGNHFESGRIGMVLMSYASALKQYFIYNNFFNTTGSSIAEYGIATRKATGEVKSCVFSSTKTNSDLTITQSSLSLTNNTLGAIYNNINATASTVIDIAPGLTTTEIILNGGNNVFSSSSSDNIMMGAGQTLYINNGYNCFQLHGSGKLHLNGGLDIIETTYDAYNNYWYTQAPDYYLLNNQDPTQNITLKYSQLASCQTLSLSIHQIIDRGNGLFDTIYKSQKPTNVYVAPDEALYNQAYTYLYNSIYPTAILNFKSLIDGYTTSSYLSGALYDLYSTYESLDTSSNQAYKDNLYSDLKTYLTEKINSKNYDDDFNDIAYNLILMCETNMGNYNDALTGYQFIAMYHPDAIARLMASWDYTEVEALFNGMGGSDKEIVSEDKYIFDLTNKLEGAIAKDSTLKSLKNQYLKETERKNAKISTVLNSNDITSKNKAIEQKEKDDLLIRKSVNVLMTSKNLSKEQKTQKQLDDIFLISSNKQQAKTDNTAITPKEFSLSQNYPNPFNPTTKINYALPKTGLVTMKIYDVTGREIQTLVNEVKQAGNYTVDFNGSSLSSGVYFYKIQSGDFISVKRMVLIK